MRAEKPRANRTLERKSGKRESASNPHPFGIGEKQPGGVSSQDKLDRLAFDPSDRQGQRRIDMKAGDAESHRT